MPVYIQEVNPQLLHQGGGRADRLGKKRQIQSIKIQDDDESFIHPEEVASRPKQQDLTTIDMPPLQSKFINDTMKDIRQKELADRSTTSAKKRQKTLSSNLLSSSGRSSNSNDWTSIFLDRLSWNPNVAQIVATSGGLVTYWNEAFASITGLSESLHNNYPLTIFELIESKLLPSLYGMLALALHDLSIVEDPPLAPTDEEKSSGSSHLSITLPCKSFPGSSTRYNITIIFMHDISSRCFIGILTPVPSAPSISSIKKSDDDCVYFSNDSHRGNEISSSDSTSGDEDQEKNQLPVKKTHCYGTAARLPSCGRMLRLYDDRLCRMIFGSE